MRQLLLTAGLLLPLALDTFALAAALGVAGLEKQDRLRVALVFTVFEAGMPIAGILVGRIAGNLIGACAGYGGIVFLFIAGFLLLRPGQDDAKEQKRLRLLAHARGLAILDLGLSIDRASVGADRQPGGIGGARPDVAEVVEDPAAQGVGPGVEQAGDPDLAEVVGEQVAGVALIAVALVLLGLKLLNI